MVIDARPPPKVARKFSLTDNGNYMALRRGEGSKPTRSTRHVQPEPAPGKPELPEAHHPANPPENNVIYLIKGIDKPRPRPDSDARSLVLTDAPTRLVVQALAYKRGIHDNQETSHDPARDRRCTLRDYIKAGFIEFIPDPHDRQALDALPISGPDDHFQDEYLPSSSPLASSHASATIPAHQPPTPAAPMLDDDRILTRDGGRYYPLSLAADFAQVHRTTLVDWLKSKAKFDGRTLQAYNSPTAGKLYLTEESVQRLANRFIKWPSKEPAGPVTLGQTDDHTGYLGLPDAARTIGVDHHTIWLWATRGKAPTDKPPNVIKCTASDYFYIHEKDVFQLKTLIPRSGLQRGRRPQLAFQP